MGVKRILTCDVTGDEVPADTKPERLSWAGNNYDLYLSDKGRERLVDFLEPILESAEPVQSTYSPVRSRRTTTPKRTDLEEVRQWARANNYTVADRGRIKQEILDAYDAAK